MTENPVIIEGESEDISTTLTRPFLAVTHKSPLVRSFEPFGAVQEFGGNVNPDTASQTLWWCSQDWASQVVQAGVDIGQLLSPTPGFVAGLNQRWLHRKVGTLRKRDVPGFYAKHPDYLTNYPTVILSTGTEHSELLAPVVASTTDLAQGTFPAPYTGLHDGVLIQLDEPLSCVAEVRYWVAHGELTAACPYRLGMIGWESSLFLEMLFISQGRDLITLADETAKNFAAEVEAPPGYVLDLGVTLEGQVTVLRSRPAWSAEPFSADPTGVLRAIVASHDFDRSVDYDRWRWTPDMKIYDRSHLEENQEPIESPDTEEEFVHA